MRKGASTQPSASARRPLGAQPAQAPQPVSTARTLPALMQQRTEGQWGTPLPLRGTVL